MDTKFKEILAGLPDKPPRSRLEPHRELIRELRRRGRTFRDIAHILAEKCEVQVTASGVHDFVRNRSRVKGKSTKRITTDAMKTAPTSIGVDSTDSARKPSTNDDVQRRIVALKARTPVKRGVPDVFQFDPTEPLRLKKPRKPEPDQ
jgi:hypothetical protein